MRNFQLKIYLLTAQSLAFGLLGAAMLIGAVKYRVASREHAKPTTITHFEAKP